MTNPSSPSPSVPTPKLGDILSCGWGYEQTRYDFYQVVGVTAKSVKIRQIAKTYVTVAGGGYATVVPVKDSFLPNEKTMTKRVSSWDSKRYSVKVSDYSWAALWDGEPESESGEH